MANPLLAEWCYMLPLLLHWHASYNYTHDNPKLFHCDCSYVFCLFLELLSPFALHTLMSAAKLPSPLRRCSSAVHMWIQDACTHVATYVII